MESVRSFIAYPTFYMLCNCVFRLFGVLDLYFLCVRKAWILSSKVLSPGAGEKIASSSSSSERRGKRRKGKSFSQPCDVLESHMQNSNSAQGETGFFFF